MKKYRVNLNRTVMENCDVLVRANSEAEAECEAISQYIGDHNWQNQETIEISVSNVEVEEEPT